MKKVLIVGAGFAGSVCAERLADAGYSITILEQRDHIGGNAYDTLDSTGCLIHPYGPHIFHTNSKRIIEYLSRFTQWRFYEHRVLARIGQEYYPMPINRTTINRFYKTDLKESEVEEFLKTKRVVMDKIETSEDNVLASVGRELCDAFFAGYTRKQWGRELSELSASVAARVPVRYNDDDRYFQDQFQFMPAEGYTAMFARMLDHPRITVKLNRKFDPVVDQAGSDLVVYTGPIDVFYRHQFGKLPYRSLQFEHEHLSSTDRFQPTGTVNYPQDERFTRITEFKHLTGQTHSGTSIVREFPTSEGEPYYPVPNKESEAIYRRYAKLSNDERNVFFVGRLAQYKYYNMDQVVGAALTAADKILGRGNSE